MIIVTLAVVTFAPPQEGQMAVVPLVPETQAAVINWVTSHDGRLVGTMSATGNLIIDGRRDALLAAALRHGALLIGLPRTSCGRPPGQGWR